MPHAMTEGEWIIICVPGDITHSSQPAAMTEAADAARPSTTAVTVALWARSMLRIETPSNTSPPGELMRSTICSTDFGSASSTALTSFAETPQNPPHESIGP